MVERPIPHGLRIGDWTLNPGSHRLTRGDESRALNPKELSVLAHLAEAAPELVSTEDLLSRSWPDVVVGDHALHEVIGRLRKALGDRARDPTYIETLARRGYRMVASVAREPVDVEWPDDRAKGIGHLAEPAAVNDARAPPAGRRGLWPALFGAAAITLSAGLLVLWEALEAPAGTTDAPIRSIAVLPLENLSADPEQEYLADAMTEMLIGDLGRIGALNVISRQSMMRFKDSTASVIEIARTLNVDAVLSGSVIRAGDRVRVSVALMDGRTDFTLWTQRYDRDLSDVLELQSDIARAVADRVRVELSPEEALALAVDRPVDPQAYDDFLRAVRIIRSSPFVIPSTWAPRTIPLLERVVEQDPGFTDGWAWLGISRAFNAFVVGGDPDSVWGARQAAERALAIDARSSRAHAALGWVQLTEWEFPAAGETWRRAVELNPSSVSALVGYTSYLQNVAGRNEEAIGLVARMRLLDPLSPTRQRDYAESLRLGRFYEESVTEIRKLRSEFPEFPSGTELDLYRALGRYQELARIGRELSERCGHPCAWQKEIRHQVGLDGTHEAYWRALRDAEIERGVADPRWLAMMSAWLGDFDLAFEWLERGYRMRAPSMWMLQAPDYFDPLRSDPRYRDLLQRIGLPEWEQDPGLLAETGRSLALLGRADEAIEHVEHAMALSPADRRSARWLVAMAFARFAAGHYEEASEWCHRAIDQSRHRYTTEDAQLLLAASDAHAGRKTGANAALNAALATWPDFTVRFVPLPPYTSSVIRDRYVTGLLMAGVEH